ncbi:MAG: Rne/Rng family ribonuclease [Alphaproteobacteria bacterium]|nr:Rne/Rng family ribonuclease [Alphaproteobacteria bacterium]MBN2779578.1 Rne/Rng family ribonuclease [Alphaproteobacteria bacterium]
MKILIDGNHPEDLRSAIINNNNVIQDFDVDTTTKKQDKGNICLAKVMRVEGSLQAAFVDYGNERHGFLPFSEIHPDYFQISDEEKKKLVEVRKKDLSDEDADMDPLDTDNDDAIETLSDTKIGKDDDLSKRELLKKYKIENVIKPNQVLLIQVVKEERGNKGAALTTYISLPGRFSVLMPNSNKRSSYGISRKIYKREDRKRIRDILKKIDIPENVTAIVRTAGIEASAAEIKQDYDYLTNLWNEIRKRTYDASVPATVHEEGSLIKRILCDMIQPNIDEVIIDGKQAFNEAKDFYKAMTGKVGKLLKEHKGKVPLFMEYSVEKQLENIHAEEVRLPSGGSIVIGQTEALVAIDVNSGKSTKGKGIEETALQTNLEAADEIARQMRLRDLAGLVVIDYIDMEEEGNNFKVEKRMRDALRPDRAKIDMRKISAFGLMELSRQRLRPSFLESSYIKCPHCRGLGVVASVQTAAVFILRQLEDKLVHFRSARFYLSVPSMVALYLLNQKRADILLMEEKYETSIIINGDDSILSIHDYKLETLAKNKHTGEYFGENKPHYRNDQKNKLEKEDADTIRKTQQYNQSARSEPTLWEKLFGIKKEKKAEEPKKKPQHQHHHRKNPNQGNRNNQSNSNQGNRNNQGHRNNRHRNYKNNKKVEK